MPDLALTKYVALLRGAGMASLEPTDQFDGDDVFRFPWIPQSTKCGHAADYHVQGTGMCNGAAADYHRALSEGRIGMVEPWNVNFPKPKSIVKRVAGEILGSEPAG